jgi:fumarylacetoacetase
MNPLGPLCGKSFATTISPWIITLEALAPFTAACPIRSPDIEIASYLQDPQPESSYSINLQATLQPAHPDTPATVICKTQFSTLYWTLRDLVAHQTVNGCNLNTGDLLATGTVSGSSNDSHGCLMELAPSGGVEVRMAGGGARKQVWLADGDTVSISAISGPGVGFGECVGKILPAKG